MNSGTDRETEWTFFPQEPNLLKPMTYYISSSLLDLSCKRRLVTCENMVRALSLMLIFQQKLLGSMWIEDLFPTPNLETPFT